MITAELALSKAFIDLFVSSDTYETPDLSTDFCRLLLDLDEDEAELVPQALANAAATLAADFNRWRAVGDLAVRFDMRELAAVLLTGQQRWNEPHQLANLATLTANPAVTDETRRRVSDAIAHETYEPVVRMSSIRMGNERARSDLERSLEIQSWPGRFQMEALRSVAPVVFVSEMEAPAKSFWRVCAALVDAGARVRRVASDVQALEQGWASQEYPLVAWSGEGIAHWRRLTGYNKVRSVVVNSDMHQDAALSRLLANIEVQMPPGFSLQTRYSESAAVKNVFSPELLSEGAFDSAEMMFLGGCSRHVLSRYSKEALHPIESGHQNHWAFDQLVTVRLLQAFKAKSRGFRSAPRSLASKIHEIAAASTSSEIGIDVTGKIYRSTAEGFETLEGDQAAIPGILLVDEAFRTYTVGGGAVVPDLLNPSNRTAVDPTILAGTPALRERRVAARSLAETAARGNDVLRSAYPELEPFEITDALKIGNEILAAGAA